MGIETILGLIFSKVGGILAAVAGVLFLFWRKQAATKRANKAEAELAGVQVTQEAAQAGAAINEEVKGEQSAIDQSLAQGDLEDLKNRFNEGVDTPPPDSRPAANKRPPRVRRRDASGKFAP